MLKSLSTIAALLLLMAVLVLTKRKNESCAKKRTRTIRSRRINVSKPQPMSGKKSMRGFLGSLIGETQRHRDDAAVMLRPHATAYPEIEFDSALLDRGWGKAPQQHTGENDKDSRITEPG
jgi:hypothetical protein